MSPSFSVVIATHRRPALLERAIRSVREQQGVAIQLLVVSDCVDPDTYAAVAPLLIPGDLFVQRAGVSGPAESRNLGLQLASHSHLMFLDDDDSFAPGCFAAFAQALEQLPTQHMLAVNVEVVDENHTPAQVQRVDFTSRPASHLWVKNFLPNNCVIYPRELAVQLRFDPDMAYEDWDYLLAALGRAPLAQQALWGPCIHKNTALERRGAANNNEQRLLDCYLRLYARYPSPTEEVAALRRGLFASEGFSLPEAAFAPRAHV